MKHSPLPISILAIRLALWFILLASLPILVLIFFVRENVHSAFLNLENKHHYNVAAMLARQVAISENVEDAQRLFSALEERELIAFILSLDGRYLAHVDAGKIDRLAEADFSPEAVRAILAQQDGFFANPSSPYYFAFAPVTGQEAVAVVAARDSKISGLMSQVERESYLQLLVSMVIVFVGSGAVIWLLVGSPVRKLTQAAAHLSAGRLDVQVDPNDMIDDLGVLGITFNTMANRIRELVENLEEQVKERTADLTAANQKLERQNKQVRQTNQKLAHEIGERLRAEGQIQRQLEYVRALSASSQKLLESAGSESDQRRLLVEALQHLVEPARVSKIFLYENSEDPELGLCSRFIVDACAPSIPTAAEDPHSAVIPWSIAPAENRRRLEAGEPVGGPVKELFAATPAFRDYLLDDVHVLSVQFFPIHFGDCWWGYVGFDDRVKEREWREEDILLLGTTAEMLSSTLQRWRAEDNLRTVNELLEQQVKVRTVELSDTINMLQQEINEREQAEAELQRVLASLERRVAARTRELSTFFDLTVLASRAANLRDVFQQAVPRILEVTRSRIICLHLFDSDRIDLQLVAQQNLADEAQVELERVPLPAPFRQWLQQPTAPLVTTSLAATELLPPAFRLAGFQSYLGAQVRLGNRIEGILSCYRFTERGFGFDEISLAMALAEQLGMVLETHRLRQTAEEMAVLEERQRLARELHDSVSQSIYSLTLFARSAREAAEDRDAARLIPNLTDIEATALHTLLEMRLLLYELRAPLLEREGLAQAIDSRLNLVERRSGIAVNYELSPAQLELPKTVEVELYQLAIEALNNIVRHAGAGAVTIRLQAANGRVQLEINDDGCGFDPRQRAGGFGLTGMQERVDRLGGKFEIRSAPGQGTNISIEVEVTDE